MDVGKVDSKSPDTITILIFFFVSALLAAFFGAVSNDLVFEILKSYQGLLAGLGATTAALIAYKAAMIKVYQDAEHKRKDEQRHYLARNLHAIRVSRFNMGRVAALLRGLHADEELTVARARRYFKIAPIGPSGGLIACLDNAAELEPRVLVQLHRLYSRLEVSERIVLAFSDDDDGNVLRTESGWIEGAKVLDDHLRQSYDICRAIISLGKEAVGSEFLLTEEEFHVAKNAEPIEGEIPEELPQVNKNAEP